MYTNYCATLSKLDQFYSPRINSPVAIAELNILRKNKIFKGKQ